MIYLDSAATTLQKPAAVPQAMAHAALTMSSPGRGGHPAAMAAADTAFACRELAAEMFHADCPDNVVFTFNATHALNIAIKSLLQPGDTVLISGYEHNAVTRPIHALEGVKVKTADAPLFQPKRMVERFRELLTPEVKAVVCTYVSNVFGYVLPIGDIARLCQEREVPLVVDASQAAGSLPIDQQGWGAAFVAMPGHKGLYGPQGTGLLLCAAPVRPLLEGGTGSNSNLQDMPPFLPDRLEAGTHNICGIAGLLEGMRYVHRRGEAAIARHETALIRRMADGLARLPGVRVYVQEPMAGCQVGVLSFTVEGKDCEVVGEELSEQGFALRAGLHCAPLAHRTAGTQDSGTVRASVSAFNTPREVDQFLHAMAHLTAK